MDQRVGIAGDAKGAAKDRRDQLLEIAVKLEKPPKLGLINYLPN
ncbi:MAG: hypothetical protein ACE5JF_12275 [Anaerolineales bacterium]